MLMVTVHRVPSGKSGRNITVESGEAVTVKAPSATLEIPQVTLNGELVLNGSLNVKGDINATGTVMDTGGNSNHHSH